MTEYVKHWRGALIGAVLALGLGCQPDPKLPVVASRQAVSAPVAARPDPAFRLLTYGLPPSLEEKMVLDAVTPRWHIEYYAVAGCEVTQALLDSVAAQNELVGRQLARRYGPDWQTRYEAELATEARQQQAASAVLDREPRIVAHRRKLKKADRSLLFFHRRLDSARYETTVDGWTETDSQQVRLTYFRYRVDTRNRQATLLSDSVVRH